MPRNSILKIKQHLPYSKYHTLWFQTGPKPSFLDIIWWHCRKQAKTLHHTPSLDIQPSLLRWTVFFFGRFWGGPVFSSQFRWPWMSRAWFDWTTPHANSPKLRLLMVKPHLPVEAKHDMNQTGWQQNLESSGILFVGKHFWWKDCNINLGYPKMVDQLETWNTLQRKQIFKYTWIFQNCV